jgi:hypothetical protein
MFLRGRMLFMTEEFAASFADAVLGTEEGYRRTQPVYDRLHALIANSGVRALPPKPATIYVMIACIQDRYYGMFGETAPAVEAEDYLMWGMSTVLSLVGGDDYSCMFGACITRTGKSQLDSIHAHLNGGRALARPSVDVLDPARHGDVGTTQNV